MGDQHTAHDKVHCHSGYTYAQRPVSFSFAGQDYTVKSVLAENRFPDSRQFFVQTENGKLFSLTYNEVRDLWQVRISDKGKSITQGADPKTHAE